MKITKVNEKENATRLFFETIISPFSPLSSIFDSVHIPPIRREYFSKTIKLTFKRQQDPASLRENILVKISNESKFVGFNEVYTNYNSNINNTIFNFVKREFGTENIEDMVKTFKYFIEAYYQLYIFECNERIDNEYRKR